MLSREELSSFASSPSHGRLADRRSGGGGSTGSPRLLLLTENFFPTHSSGGRLLTALAEDLVERGVEVTVLASRGNYRGDRKLGSLDTHNGIQIRRLPAGSFPREWPLGRLVNESILTLGLFLAVLLGPRAERILVTSSPPFLAPAIALAARLRRAELVFVAMDVYPEMAAATGLLRPESFAYRCWDTLSRFAYRRASQVVVLGRCMKQVVQRKLSSGAAAPYVIPNWADGREVRPLAPSEPNRFFREYPELEGKFIVQYSGNFGRFHDFETILRAAEKLRDRQDIVFTLIGQGARLPWLERQVAGRDLANVRLLPFQPQENLPHSLAAQSVALVTLERGTEGLCVPSKFYPVLAAGKPVIAVMESWAEVARVVEEEGIGYVVAQDDVEALVSAVEELSSDPETCREMGSRARQLQQERYDRSDAVERYHEVLIGSRGVVSGA